MAAEVKVTEASGGDVMGQEHVVPNLMTRSRTEHKLESLRRERGRIEHAMTRLEEESTRLHRPINQDLMDSKAKEITQINEQMEATIQILMDLNKGVNHERDDYERKQKEEA